MPSRCARCSTASRSGPSPTRQRCVDPALASRREGGEHVREALDRGHAADPADHEGVSGIAEEPPQRRARRPSPSAMRSVEVDPEPDDLNCSGGATPSSTRSSRTSGLTATSRVVVPRERSFDLRVDGRPSRVEVAAQDVPVEGVHDDRRPASPASSGGGAADRACLRGVGVEDVRADAPDQPHDGGDRERVEDRRDFTVQVRDVDDLDPELVRDERHRALASRQRARAEGGRVSALVEAAGEVGDVQRGAAHVEPRDQPEDANLGSSAIRSDVAAVRRRPSSSGDRRLVAEHLPCRGQVGPRVADVARAAAARTPSPPAARGSRRSGRPPG